MFEKERKYLVQLQEAVDKEIKHLLAEEHIEKVNEIEDDVFIQPTVITLKKDRLVKSALEARALNQETDKDKHQMPNLANLLDMIAKRIDKKAAKHGNRLLT